MDTTPQKPFACKTEGCGMTFTNEDHLIVHEKKHEMVLNLGLETKGTNVFVGDQTPTPTRLIKNCEEVGLFDDLKHVNPFDETFRRAVESKNNNDHQNVEIQLENNHHSLIENPLLNTNEDSLHTPQVFPTITVEEEVRGEFRIEKQNVILSDNINFKIKKGEDTNNDTNNDNNNENNNKEEIIQKQEENKKRKLPRGNSYKYGARRKISKKTSSSQVNISEQIKPVETSAAIATTTTLPIILPATISVIQPQLITLGIPTATSLAMPSKRIILPKPIDINQQMSILQSTAEAPATATAATVSTLLPIKERLKEVLNDAKRISIQNEKAEIATISPTEHKVVEKVHKVSSKTENSKIVYDDDCMERRRAAAMRYRSKIKKEQSDLKRRNAELVAENSELKAIIKHLKQALMAHQNCEISRSAHLGTTIQLDDRTSIQTQPVKLIMNIPKIILHPAGKITPITPMNVTPIATTNLQN